MSCQGLVPTSVQTRKHIQDGLHCVNHAPHSLFYIFSLIFLVPQPTNCKLQNRRGLCAVCPFREHSRSRKPCKGCYWPELYCTTSAEKLKQFSKNFLVCYVCSKHRAYGEDREMKEPHYLLSRSLLFSGETSTYIIYSKHINALIKLEAEWTLIAQKPEEPDVGNK